MKTRDQCFFPPLRRGVVLPVSWCGAVFPVSRRGAVLPVFRRGVLLPPEGKYGAGTGSLYPRFPGSGGAVSLVPHF